MAEVFRRVDTDGSGWVDEDEFSEALSMLRQGCGGTQAETDAMWYHIARKRSRVGFEQFCAALREPPLPVGWQASVQSALRLRMKSKGGVTGSAAAILDAMCAAGGSAGLGQLSVVGWRRAVQRLGLGLSARQCDVLFATVDTNSDGAVDIHELLAWLNAEQGTPRLTAATAGAGAMATVPAVASLSVEQARATEAVGAAVGAVVADQFGGSSETALLWMLEVTPRALNQPDPEQAAAGGGGPGGDDDGPVEWESSQDFNPDDLDDYFSQARNANGDDEDAQGVRDAEERERLLGTSLTRKGWLAALPRLFMLSSTGTEPTAGEALALFYTVTGAKADVAGYMRLPEFKMICGMGKDGSVRQREELRPPPAIDYIGRNWQGVLASLATTAAAARRDAASGGGFGGGGLEETVGQAAEGYSTVPQLRKVLSQPQPAGSAGSAGSNGGGPRRRLALSAPEWEELGKLAGAGN